MRLSRCRSDRQVVEVSVYAAFFEELFVRSFLRYSAFGQHDYALGLAHCREPVGYRYGGAALRELGQLFLHVVLALVVER